MYTSGFQHKPDPSDTRTHDSYTGTKLGVVIVSQEVWMLDLLEKDVKAVGINLFEELKESTWKE